MKREEALELMSEQSDYGEIDLYDALQIVNKIYDEFNGEKLTIYDALQTHHSRICATCEYYEKDYFKEGKNFCAALDSTNVHDEFSCGEWELNSETN